MNSEKATEGHPVVFESFPERIRIETQIHRRCAAKALSPLTLEWEQAKPTPPDQRTDQE